MLKVSGEALSGGTGSGIDAVTINQCAGAIKKLHDLGCDAWTAAVP